MGLQANSETQPHRIEARLGGVLEARMVEKKAALLGDALFLKFLVPVAGETTGLVMVSSWPREYR